MKLIFLIAAMASILLAVSVQASDPVPYISSFFENSDTLTYWTPQKMATMGMAAEHHQAQNQRVLTADGDENGYAPVKPVRNLVPGAVGRLFFRRPDGSPGSCSAAVVDSPDHNMVLTASHCLGTQNKWNNNFAFVPGYQGNVNPVAPFGIWVGARAAGFDYLSYPGMDTGALMMESNIENAVGALTPGFNQHDQSIQYTADVLGYPSVEYDGKTLLYCLGQWDVQQIVNGELVTSNCGPKSGNSGGPILIADKGVLTNKIIGVVTSGSEKNGALDSSGSVLIPDNWKRLTQSLKASD